MRPNVYDKESYYGSTMAIFKVIADCKNKFNSNQNVFKNICFTKGHIIPELTPGFLFLNSIQNILSQDTF
jgi:hypothetical protein